MARGFLPYTLDQRLLLPPDMRAWPPDGHAALFVSDVVDALDLSAIYSACETGDDRGQKHGASKAEPVASSAPTGDGLSVAERMRQKLPTVAAMALYRMRKAIVKLKLFRHGPRELAAVA